MTFEAQLRRHARHAAHAVEDEAARYDPAGGSSLAGYAGSLVAYGMTATVLTLAGRVGGRTLPDHYRLDDVALGGLATYKFTRLLSKASVTSPLRAYFTQQPEPTGSAEQSEQARGTAGLRHTVGELVTCPFCLGQWVGTAYVAGLTLAPRATRTWAAVFAVTAISDNLQQLYARIKE
jgi:uncharacterized membrane protein YbhN (UPF0104 family)